MDSAYSASFSMFTNVQNIHFSHHGADFKRILDLLVVLRYAGILVEYPERY